MHLKSAFILCLVQVISLCVIGSAQTVITNTRMDFDLGNGNTSVEEVATWHPAAIATSWSTATTLWDLNSTGSPTPGTVTGTYIHKGVLNFSANNSAAITLSLPNDFTQKKEVFFVVEWLGSSPPRSVTWSVLYFCTSENSELDDKPFISEVGSSASTADPGDNKLVQTFIAFKPNSCGQGADGTLKNLMHILLRRDDSDASPARFLGMRIGIWRDKGNPAG